MSNKLLSIIIPSYNMQDYLAKCLNSLIVSKNQMEKIEILVINDGSKDNTSEIAHSYEEKYPDSIIVIDKQNGNYGSCINRGLEEATGKYVKVLDADDRFETSNFIKFIDFLSSVNDVDLILTDYYTVTTKCDFLEKFSFDCEKNQILTLDKMSEQTMINLQMHGLTYKTQLLKKIKYKQTEGISYTDTEWCFYPMSSVKTFCYFNEVIYLYTIDRAGQTMDPKVFLKNKHMEIQITEKMIESYDRFLSLGSETNNKHLHLRLVITRIIDLYDIYLLIYPRQTILQQLIDFDNFFSQAHNKLYIECGEHTCSKRFPIKYISTWRKNHNRKCLKLIALRIFLKLRSHKK